MAMKSLSFLLIFASLAFSSVSVSAWGGRKALEVEAPAPEPVADDAFVVLDTKTSDVIGVARFAVDEYNKVNQLKLRFSKVYSAAYTVTSKGVLYGLVMGAADETGVRAYDANVLVTPNAKKLLSFWRNEFADHQ